MRLHGIGRIAPAVVLVLCAGLAPAALAAPGGRARTVQYLGSLADHDPAAPRPGHEPWTPAAVVDLLAARPHASVALGRDDGLPPGNGVSALRRREADRIRALATALGVDVADRLCVPARIDVQRKLRDGHAACDPAFDGRSCAWEGDMDGSKGEREEVVVARGQASGAGAATLVASRAGWRPGAWAERLLVVRPGSALEERRRITSNDATTLELASAWQTPPHAGDAFEIRGSFDPAWVMRTPAAVHAASMRRFWSEQRNVCGRTRNRACAPPAEPLDPFAPGNTRGWRPDVDRSAFAALASPAGLPALFGTIHDADPQVAYLTDPYPSVDSVVMDLRNPAYRAWRIRSLLYTMQDLGVEPGAPACVIVGYEPALHASYDEAGEGPSRHPCAMPGTGSWEAPLHVCSDATQDGGPLDPTGYGPGEFEAGVSAFLRELLATLPEQGYRDLRVVTAEGEPLRGRPWSTLASDVRFDARVVGELDGARPPALATIARAAEEADDASGGGGGAAKQATARAARGWQSRLAAPSRKSRSAPPANSSPPANSGPPSSSGSASSSGSSSGSGSASWSLGSEGRSKPKKSPVQTASNGWSRTTKPTKPGKGATASTPTTGTSVPTTSPTATPPSAPARPTSPPTIPTTTTSPTVQPALLAARPDPVRHPNEPAGMAPRWPTNPMHTLPPTSPAAPDGYGYKCWPDQCRSLTIQNDPTSPGSDPSVMRIGYPKGFPGGQSPSRFLAGTDFGGKRRLYTSVYLYVSPNWTNGGNVGTKFFFMRAAADGVQNHYVNLAGGVYAPFSTGVFLQKTDGSGNRNLPTGPIPLGRWMQLEVYLEMNTPGAANGVAKLWLDGVAKVDASDVEWVARRSDGRTLRELSWDHLWVDPTYGGGSNPVPIDDMYFQIDDWYTSVGD